jgi:hypothetical protein
VSTKIAKRRWGGVAALLLVAGCGTASADKSEAKPAAGPESQAATKASLTPALLVPADAAGFVHVRVADLWRSEALSELRQILAKAGPGALQLLEQKYVPAPADVESVTVIFQTAESVNASIFSGRADRVSPVLVVTTTKALDRAQLTNAFGPNAEAAKHKDHSYFRVAASRSAFQVVDEHTFAVASEAALRQWLSRPAGTSTKGPLQAALLQASQKHAVVLGFNPAALPSDPFGPFRSAQTTFNTVGNVIGSAPAPAAKPKADPWATVAKPLLKARCLTLTFDLDSQLHGNVQLDFDSAEQTETGVKAVRAGLEATREAIATAIGDLEREVREGRKTFTFGQPPAKKPEGPRPLARDADQALEDVFNVVQIGLYRAASEQLRTLPVERQGNSVRLETSVPVNTSTLMFAVAAIASLGTRAETTFNTVGSTIEALPESRAEPRANPVFTPVLPAGTRAVAVRVNADSSAAIPLSRVDLIWSKETDEDTLVSKILVENALVVAADIPARGEKTAVVTLALTPEDATRVAHAEATGSFSLALRAPQDDHRKAEPKR